MYSRRQTCFNTFNDNKVEKKLFVFIVLKDIKYLLGLFYESNPLHIAVQKKITATECIFFFLRSANIRKKGELAFINNFTTRFSNNLKKLKIVKCLSN